MTNVLQGQDITVTGTFLEYAGGPPAAVSSVAVRIVSAATGTTVVGPTSTGVQALSTGVYSYTWSVPASQAVGDYTLTFTAVDAQLDNVSTSGTFTVAPYTDETWATVVDVLTYTGREVGISEVFQAQVVIEIFSGTTILSSQGDMISSRNLRLLKYAVAYEAAFIAEHPGIFTDEDLSNYSQDGAAGTYSHVNAALLAPLAKRCLDRLSWKLEPLKVGRRFRDAVELGIGGNTMSDNESGDKYLVWEPL